MKDRSTADESRLTDIEAIRFRRALYRYLLYCFFSGPIVNQDCYYGDPSFTIDELEDLDLDTVDGKPDLITALVAEAYHNFFKEQRRNSSGANQATALVRFSQHSLWMNLESSLRSIPSSDDSALLILAVNSRLRLSLLELIFITASYQLSSCGVDEFLTMYEDAHSIESPAYSPEDYVDTVHVDIAQDIAQSTKAKVERKPILDEVIGAQDVCGSYPAFLPRELT